MTEMLRFCDRFAVNAFDLYLILRLFRVMFNDGLYKQSFLYSAISVNMAVRLLESYYVPYIWVNMLTNVFLIFMLACCYKSPMKKRLAVTAGILILLALAEIAIARLIGIRQLSFLDTASNGESISLFLSRILFWLLATLLLKIMVRDNPYPFSRKVAVLETMIFLILGSEFLFLCVRKQESIVTESMLLFTAELTFYLMIYLRDCLGELFVGREQANRIEQEKEYYQREAVIIQQKQELLKQFRHDLKNRLQVLEEIAKGGDMRELTRYLREIEAKQREQEIFSNTGNLIIDSIINSKLGDAQEKGIEIHASVVLPAAIEVGTDDMVVILGNLLDNAIEACERMDSAKYIKLLMSYEKGCILLSVKNSFDQVIRSDYGEFMTRKKEKSLHGLGIKSVKNAVENYNGIAEFTCEGAEFSADILLYLQ